MVRDGRLTGGVEGATLWGSGKAQAVRDFANAHGITLSDSYGYANGNEDIAFLKTVGHATAVNPKPVLVEAAQREGWTVLRLPARRTASVAIARAVSAPIGRWRRRRSAASRT
jgi:putative phosphoserine phosphatase/1-acylglycerol-3-phosphate O-acyltransferase